MRHRDLSRSCIGFAAIFWLAVVLPSPGNAQTAANERTFPQSKAVVERALKEVQAFMSGRLPTLDGFAAPGDKPFDRFQRGFYQCSVQVIPQPSGVSLVRVSAKITAWYAAPVPAQSGYQVLASNGRLESDLLDRLADALNPEAAPRSSVNTVAKSAPASTKNSIHPAATSAAGAGSSVPDAPSTSMAAQAFHVGTSPDNQVPSVATQRAVADRHLEALRTDAKNLEEILRNQSHPTNLIAVKKAGTPVLASPSEGAKVLFLAAAEDEFEMIDLNADWVHVRISGLSRGWLRRSSVEMNGASVAQAAQADVPAGPPAKPVNPAPFLVEHEEIGSFPGEWQPLRGKSVKIISVQPATSTGGGSQEKLDFAKSLLNKEYTELTQTPTTVAGVVVVFDSADGGMLAATLVILGQWKEGTLSDEAFWRRCYVDPPEMLPATAGQ